MEPILTIRVAIHGAETVEGARDRVTMIPFSAEAVGPCFFGHTVSDGVDTQLSLGGRFSLSARYLMEGTDSEGRPCRLFIENNGPSLDACHPRIVTDSPALAALADAALTAKVEPCEGGVIVRIYRG